MKLLIVAHFRPTKPQFHMVPSPKQEVVKEKKKLTRRKKPPIKITQDNVLAETEKRLWFPADSLFVHCRLVLGCHTWTVGQLKRATCENKSFRPAMISSSLWLWSPLIWWEDWALDLSGAADGEQGPPVSLIIPTTHATFSSTSKSPSKTHVSQELEKNRAAMYSGFILCPSESETR